MLGEVYYRMTSFIYLSNDQGGEVTAIKIANISKTWTRDDCRTSGCSLFWSCSFHPGEGANATITGKDLVKLPNTAFQCLKNRERR